MYDLTSVTHFRDSSVTNSWHSASENSWTISTEKSESDLETSSFRGRCFKEAGVCILVGRLTAEKGSYGNALEQLELSAVDSRGDLFTGVEAAQGEALALWVENRVLRACGICVVPHLQRAVDGGGAGRGGQGQDAGEGGELHLEMSAVG